MDTKSKVHLLIIENHKQLSDLTFHHLLNAIPKHIQRNILKYQKWEDRQATLLGKKLLIKGLRLLKNDVKIESIQEDNFKRPFLGDLKTELDFNISHCDGIVVCALSQQNRVGVDVEKIQTIIPSDYKSVFTKREFENIQKSDDATKQLETFFKYWTCKEAIMKGDGRGFYLEPSTFEAIENEVIVEEKKWHVQHIDINEILKQTRTIQVHKDLYYCHIATSQPAIIEAYIFDINQL